MSNKEETKTKEETNLEDDFKVAYHLHIIEIKEQLKIAKGAIAVAEAIAEQYGIPFDSDVSPICQTYTPTTLPSTLAYDLIEEITGVYPGGDTAGWE